MTSTPVPEPKSQVIPAAANARKIAVLAALLLASFFAATRVAEWFAATWAPPVAGALTWATAGLLAIFNVVMLLGMAVLAHDAVHRVLFRSAFWNEFWGGLLSALTLIPFHANRQFHLTHHAYAHQPGLDPEEAMHRHSFLYAVTVGSLIGLKEQYRILFANLRRVQDRRCAVRALKDVAALGAAAAIYFGLLPALGISVAVTVAPTMLVFPLVFAFRAMSDHYGIPAVARGAAVREDVVDADGNTWQADRERRQREVSGWVVLTAPWLEWLWSNVNYHEVHHKYPYLSHCYLPQVFAATRGRLAYLVVPGYWRSLLNLRRREYYSQPHEAAPFLDPAEAVGGGSGRATSSR